MKRYEKYKNEIISTLFLNNIALSKDYKIKACYGDMICKNCAFSTTEDSYDPYCATATKIYELWDKICENPCNFNKMNLGVNKNDKIVDCGSIDCADCILKDCNIAEYLNEEELLPLTQRIISYFRTDENFNPDKITIAITKEEADLLRKIDCNTDILTPIANYFSKERNVCVKLTAEIIEKLSNKTLQLCIKFDYLVE